MGEWGFLCSSGYRSIRFRLELFHEDLDCAEFCVVLTEQTWYRADVLRDPPDYGNPVDDHVIRWPQLLVARAKLEQLLTNLDLWLQHPFIFRDRLQADPHQIMILTFGHRADRIDAPDRPTLTIRYKGGGLKLKAMLALDETCIGLARNELALLVGRIGPT